mmetsp:Transcript_23773/g.67210  ORF Transcript_23773/g.67210 Transcript_23773/m.67210 type:complete len:419 (-) Transcript_23773:700-1956(-)
MRERDVRFRNFNAEGINLVNEKDAWQHGILDAMVLVVAVPACVSCVSRSLPAVVSFVVLLFEQFRHERAVAFREEVPVGLHGRLFVLDFVPFFVQARQGFDVLLQCWEGVFANVSGRDELDEVLEETGGSRFIRHDFGDPVERLVALLRSECQLVDDVGGIVVGRIFRREDVDVPPVALDAFSHGDVEVAADAVDRHVPAEVAPLSLDDLLRLFLVASFAHALLRGEFEQIRLPLFGVVGRDDVVAGLAALVVLLLRAVARAAVILRKTLLEQPLLLVLLLAVEVHVHLDLVRGERPAVPVQSAFDQRVFDVQLRIARHVDGIQVQILARQRREGDVEVDAHAPSDGGVDGDVLHLRSVLRHPGDRLGRHEDQDEYVGDDGRNASPLPAFRVFLVDLGEHEVHSFDHALRRGRRLKRR